MHTLWMRCGGKFARVCIEIELDKPVVDKVWFREFWYHEEYEGLHLLCPVKVNVNVSSGSETPMPTQPPSNPKPNTVSNNGDPEIIEDNLYGDWLVFNRRKNQGWKPRPKLQGDLADILGKTEQFDKDPNDKRLDHVYVFLKVHFIATSRMWLFTII
ncbi:hypothetical protein A2U01_0002733 [Trifolium medium]|uniref:Uncharacterized protein n=1 Tax=Trifolium medium TaxID=97028 RepID=A0A392M3U6_9FABA|nr:hypothetical protein [Trifolium medium]